MIADVGRERFVLDGELILPVDDVLSFDALQARLHPAASRIAQTVPRNPAQLMLFDCLALDGNDLIAAPLTQRRESLEAFHASHGATALLLSDRTTEIAEARCVARRAAAARSTASSPSGSTSPTGRASARCSRSSSIAPQTASSAASATGKRGQRCRLAAAWPLRRSGSSSITSDSRRASLRPSACRCCRTLEALIEAPGFTGKAPGGPSRWNSGKETEWNRSGIELVVEVLYDQVTGQRFRHGTTLLRWRPDKSPSQCDMGQLIHELRPAELATMGAPGKS